MKKRLIVLGILVTVLAISAWGLRNPSAVYCSQLGYEYITKQTPEGDVGACKFSDGTDCEGWDFLQGACGMQHSYCSQKGYQQRTGTGTDCGSTDPTATCLLCIMQNGSAVEVGNAMNLYSKLDDMPVISVPETTSTITETTATKESTTTTEEESVTTIETVETTEPTPTTEETTTLPTEATTTTIPEIVCGNSVCDPSENFDSCSKDCSKPTGPVDYLPYIVIIVVLLVIIFVVKRKLDEKKIAKEKAEFEKWKQEKGGTGL